MNYTESVNNNNAVYIRDKNTSLWIFNRPYIITVTLWRHFVYYGMSYDLMLIIEDLIPVVIPGRKYHMNLRPVLNGHW